MPGRDGKTAELERIVTEHVGFIGLGRMGSAMVKRMSETGAPPLIWNRDPSKTNPLRALGCAVAATPQELASESDVIIACVHDAAAVESVLFGPSGASFGGKPGRVFIDMSTIGPVATAALAKRLAESCGMTWIDAPVSGGVPAAERGKLIVMAGGSPDGIKRVEPILGRIAERITHVGKVGAGQAVKAINQLIVAGYVATIAEALSLAERHGMDVAKLPDVLKGGLADSNILQNQGRRMAAQLEHTGSAAIMIKDLDIASTMASAVAHPLPVGSLVSQLYRLQAIVGYDAYGMIGLMQLFRGDRGS
jgi:3-hydroxyisobutyrate dehydrogenase-like beta-hydroxyacid dehydrogenase